MATSAEVHPLQPKNVIRFCEAVEGCILIYWLPSNAINHLRVGNLRSQRATHKFHLMEEHAMDHLSFMIIRPIDEGFIWGRIIFSDKKIVSTDYNRFIMSLTADKILE